MISLANKFYGYLKKDFVLLYKRKKYLYTFILLPIIISLLFLLVLNPSDYKIQAGVCNFDDSDLSSEALSGMQNFEIEIYAEENCEENLKEQIAKGKISLGIVIPEGFSESIENLERVGIIAYYDTTDVAFANLISWKLDKSMQPFERKIIDELNTEFTSRVEDAREGVDLISENLPSRLSSKLDDTSQELENLENMETDFLLNPINTHHKPIYEKDLKKDAGLVFVFPLLALFITLMLSSTSIIYDKKTNFMTRVKSSTSPAIYLAAKLLFFTFLVLVEFLIILALFLLYGAKYPISIINILELVISIGIINTLFGFLIGLISENEGIAVLFSLIISFPLMLTSGIFFPTQTLPTFVQWISKILPLNFQIQASKSVLLFNQNMSNYWMFAAIGLFALCWYFIRKK